MATYVLIHGAGDSAWAWHRLDPELRRHGHDVVAMDLPCEDDRATFGDYADVVVAAAGEGPGRIVVAHSLGGFTAGLVCDRMAVEQVVLVAAMVPAPGESAGDWWASTAHATAPGADDDIALYLHDLPPELAAEAMRRERGQSGTPMAEPWPLDAWPPVPTRYLLARDDRFLPPDFARRHARERLGVVADEIPGSHAVALSRPAELADRLEALRPASG